MSAVLADIDDVSKSRINELEACGQIVCLSEQDSKPRGAQEFACEKQIDWNLAKQNSNLLMGLPVTRVCSRLNLRL